MLKFNPEKKSQMKGKTKPTKKNPLSSLTYGQSSRKEGKRGYSKKEKAGRIDKKKHL